MDRAGLSVPDAISFRLSGNAAALVQPGISAEAIVNFRSGELSYFSSGSVGAGPAAGASFDGGASAIYDLPNNHAYRGFFGSAKIDAKYWGGVTGEVFTALPIQDFPYGNTSCGAAGLFAGAGVEASFTVNLSYAVELRCESASGVSWLPQLSDYNPIQDVGEVLYQAYWGLGLLMFGKSWTEYAQ